MKLLGIILLFSLHASATNYYVSNTGSDASNGLTSGTAWQTISKVNNSSFLAGDSILFKCGDSWNEQLRVPSSNIIFSSYGVGLKPKITAWANLTLSGEGSNIWSATALLSPLRLNTVFINGAMRHKARVPNSGYNSVSNSIVNKYQLSTNLSGTPNYTGAEAVVRTAHWILDVCKISSQSGGTLNFSDSLTYSQFLFGGSGFFLQNDRRFLDVQNEWAYDSTSKLLSVYSTSQPSVKYSVLDTLVYCKKDGVTFYGLHFTGANFAGLFLDSSRGTTIYNCKFEDMGAFAIQGQKSNLTRVIKDSILNAFTGGVYLRQFNPYTPQENTCDSLTIDSNYIKNVGHIAGMGLGNNSRYVGIHTVGHDSRISNNILDSCGYIPLFFNGKRTVVYQNFIKNFGFAKDDGGGIYTVIGNYFASDFNDNSIVRKNISINGIGASDGTNTASYMPGIYLDDFSRYITIDSNTIDNCFASSLYLHNTNNITARENTVVDSIGVGLYILGTNGDNSAFNLKQNIYYSKNATFANVFRDQGTTVATMDSNYYSRPSSEATKLNLNGTVYSLSGWVTATSQDSHSAGTPSGITGATPLFYYNPTLADSTIAISGTYYDSRSNVFLNSVTLKPFTSVVLFKATSEYRQRVLRNLKYNKINQ